NLPQRLMRLWILPDRILAPVFDAEGYLTTSFHAQQFISEALNKAYGKLIKENWIRDFTIEISFESEFMQSCKHPPLSEPSSIAANSLSKQETPKIKTVSHSIFTMLK
ncbi:26053_t:CDS:2, partial [Gigaspora rosea]